MLGSSKITALLGAAPDPTADTATLKAYLRTLAKVGGLHMFLVVPGAKEPAECRTTQAKNKAIKEAEAAGLPKPMGLHMATDNPTLLGRWLDKYRKDRDDDTPVNVAMEVGRSRIILVDTDTPEEMAAFLQLWADASDDQNLLYVSPTVRSPGVFDEASGQWIHKDGGHFYFTFPADVTLPDGPGSITMGPKGSQFTIYWRDRYVLIPPSRRKEGDYRLEGTDHPAPPWLIQMILDRGAEVAARKEQRAKDKAERVDSGEVDPIAAWGERTPWADVLEPRDWVFSGRLDSCGCEIWTRPGNPANTKSATVHGDACSDARYDPESPAIHVWSDNVEGGLADWIAGHGKTLSRLQFVAAVDHGGDIKAAMDALGIQAEGGQSSHGEAVAPDALRASLGVTSSKNLAAQLSAPTPAPKAKPVLEITDGATSVPATVTEDAHGITVEADLSALFASPTMDTEGSGDPDVADAEDVTEEDAPELSADDLAYPLPLMAPFKHWRSLPPPEFIVEGWLEDQGLLGIIGPSNVGKSAVVLDMACSITEGIPWQGKATKKSKVLYIAGEGAAGASQRVKAWEAEHGRDVGENLWMISEAVLVGSSNPRLWPWMAERVKAEGIRLVIFDTLARMSLGLEENSASDMGNAVARFDRLRREAETAVLVVHHTARGQSHGRGSTAILGALDSEVLIELPEDADDQEDDHDGPKRITATVTKQKNAASGESLDLTILPRHGSIIVADRMGNTGDPLSGANVMDFPAPTPPESSTELAIRLAEYLVDYPMQGATKADMLRGVTRSKAYRRDTDGWRSAVIRAVDRGLATGLMATFGTDAAQRYVRGSATPAQALALDTAEADDQEAQSV